jgi:hypothetical protein
MDSIFCFRDDAGLVGRPLQARGASARVVPGYEALPEATSVRGLRRCGRMIRRRSIVTSRFRPGTRRVAASLRVKHSQVLQ